MLTHDQVWTAIDALAERHGFSPSGLARKAGLDSTAFNKSKRLSADGRPRWPSTESVAKILEATGSTLAEFTGLLAGRAYPVPAAVPLLGVAQAGAGGFYDDAGFPAGHGLETIEFPAAAADQVYALKVQGDSMAPVYRDGDRLIVQPGAEVRKGDRIVVRTAEGEVMAKVLGKRSATGVELLSLNPDHPPRHLKTGEIGWIARILWASQ